VEIQSMLDVDVRDGAAQLLRFGQDVLAQRGFAG
jgi:hypothetical protein